MKEKKALKKNLTLFDVFAICTGAMFSSGFFLLPGIAAAQSGPSVVLAYFLASLLILPAMVSVAELSTAMPKSGGTYFFIDRSMGPLAGTIGGVGTWVALVLKSAFALIGMGAYLAIFFDVPIKPLAVALTLGFMTLNIVGAKETTGLQRILVGTLVTILAYFSAMGLFEALAVQEWQKTVSEFEPFMPNGFDGLMATVGLVFVSYAGLTKVTSVAEEVQDPDRNIPLGMALSLFTATALYCLGVFVMVALLEPDQLRQDLTPVATAGEVFLDFLPGGMGLVLIVIAAIAAFASTGNAGILSASRYPMAMARDRLLPASFAKIGHFGTPTVGIVVTSLSMIVILVLLDIEAVVKLASAFQLFVFGILNLAVIVMRESKIDFYRPGFRSPLYPWVQIAGLLIPVWLVAQMGWEPVAMCVAVSIAAVIWYYAYAGKGAERSGAIYHVFQRLGERRDVDLDHELRRIMGDKGLRESDPYREVVERAEVLDLSRDVDFDGALRIGAERLARDFGLDAEELHRSFIEEIAHGLMPICPGAAVPQHLYKGVDHPEMLIMRLQVGATIDFDEDVAHIESHGPVRAVIFLLSPDDEVGAHLRMLAKIASHTEDEAFVENWTSAISEQGLKALLVS